MIYYILNLFITYHILIYNRKIDIQFTHLYTYICDILLNYGPRYESENNIQYNIKELNKNKEVIKYFLGIYKQHYQSNKKNKHIVKTF